MVRSRALLLAGVTGLTSIVAAMPATAMQAPPGARATQDFPPFEKISEGFTEVAPADGARGMYRVWVNKKTQRTLAELPRNFEKQDLFMAWTVASGVQTSAVQTGDQYARWKRFGKRLALVEPNYAVISSGDKQSKDATQRVFTDRVILEVPILTMGPGGGPVIDLNSLFVNQATSFFGRVAAGANSRLATVEKAKTFPGNVELCYQMPLSSGRFAKLYYSIALIPSNTGYRPREADDRVGYFTTSIQDLGDPAADTPWKRYVNRWNIWRRRDPQSEGEPAQGAHRLLRRAHRAGALPALGARRRARCGTRPSRRSASSTRSRSTSRTSSTGAHMDKDPEDVRDTTSSAG